MIIDDRLRRIVSKAIRASKNAWLEPRPTGSPSDGETIGFVDTNLGLDHAIACADELKVVYYIDEGGAYPHLKDERSGDGFPGINKVECMADATACDYVAFLDCYYGRDADDLRKAGKNVYGPSHWWTEIENDRRKGWLRLREMGIEVPEGVIVKGLKALLDYIKANQGNRKAHFFNQPLPWAWESGRGSSTIICVMTDEDVSKLLRPERYKQISENPESRVFFIKTSKYRGSKETGGSVINWVEALVSVTQGMFGPYLTDMEFLVQDKCPGVELGVDVYFNGKGGDWLRPYLFTIEEKGSGTVGKWVESSPVDDLLLKKILPSVVKTDYRGLLCFEFFYDEKGRIRVHDPCARNSYPCSAIQAHRIKNYPELLQAVARGESARIEVGEEYETQVGLYTDDKDSWRPIRFPEAIRLDVGFRRAVIKDGEYYYCPGDFLVTTALGSGDTVEKAIDKATEVVRQIECSDSSYPGGFKQDVLKKIEMLNSWPTDLKF